MNSSPPASFPSFKRLRAPSATHDVSPFTPSHPSPLRQTFSSAAESLFGTNERRGSGYVHMSLGEIREEEVVEVEVISPREGPSRSMVPFPPVIETEVPRDVNPSTTRISPKRRPSELALPAHPNSLSAPKPQPLPSPSHLSVMVPVPLTSPLGGLYSAGLPARVPELTPSHLFTLFSAGLNAFTPLPSSGFDSPGFLDDLIDLYVNTPYSALLELRNSVGLSSPVSSKFGGDEFICYSSLLSPSYFLKSPL